MAGEESLVRVLEAVHALAPLIRECAAQAEADRRYPARVIEAMAHAGVFRMLVPCAAGGLELDPVTLLDVVEAVSRVDGSAGWTAMIGSGAGFMTGYLPTDLVVEMFRDPLAFLCGNLGAPTARAVAVQGGYRVSGRWPFVSGCDHATWLGGCAVLESGEPRILVFPRSACEIVDTWTVTGLRATGSHDVAVADVFVPRERSFWWTEAPVSPSPLYQVRFMVITHAAHALGLARAALDAFVELAATKKPTRGSGALLKDHALVQVQVAQAEALVQSARDFMWRTTAEAWSALSSGGTVSARQRTLLRLAMTNAVQASAQAVDLMWSAAGGSPMYVSSPLERTFRDIHVATQHAAVSSLSWETVGRGLLDPAYGATLI